ncbi:hypothetical protein KAJ27_04360 [bacterium]|nr:hypothetical protein [bacterium]
MENQSKNLAIMFTDLKGFTERTSRISRTMMRTLLRVHEELVLPIIDRFGGYLVKNIGDAFLVTFESPTNAVICGLVIQNTFKEYNSHISNADESLEIRIAINSGEVEIKDGDVYGEAVNIAARIESITEVNEVYFTESVYLAMNKHEVPSSEVGLRRLKGIPEEIKVYKVIQDSECSTYKAALDCNSWYGKEIPVTETDDFEEIEKTTQKSFHSIFMKIASFLILALVISTTGYNLHLATNTDKTTEYSTSPNLSKSIVQNNTSPLSVTQKIERAVEKKTLIPKQVDIKKKDNAIKKIAKRKKRNNKNLVSFNFNNEKLSVIFSKIACKAKKNIIIDSSVKGTYSCFLSKVTPNKALKILVDANDLKMDRKKGIFYISSRNETPKKEAKIITKPEVKVALIKEKKVQKKPRLYRNKSISNAISNMDLTLTKKDKKILVHLITKLLRDGQKFYQDADACAKVFLSWTKDPSKKKMKSIILSSLKKSSEKIKSIEDAIDSVKYTTYSKTKWSKAWGNMTSNKLGGKRLYRVKDTKTGKILNIGQYMTNEYDRVRAY